MTLLNPYLGFRDNAREAMQFYHSVFGGELDLTTFAEGGMPHDPAEADHVMHSQLESPAGLVLMASDAPTGMPVDEGSSVSISLSGEDEAELREYWDKLVDGGNVTMPLDPAPWGGIFGMCTDRFGTKWLVNVNSSPES